MRTFIFTILWLILAASPGIGYFCFKTKQRAWITLIVIVFFIDIVVLIHMFKN